MFRRKGKQKKPFDYKRFAWQVIIICIVLAAFYYTLEDKPVDDKDIAYSIDLKDHEGGAHNGHTIARHVGKSDDWLRQRLARQPNIPAASTFPNLRAANATVSWVLTKNRQNMEGWLSGARRTYNARSCFKTPVGRGIIRGQSEIIAMNCAVVRMEKVGGSFVIYTAYPEAR